MRVSDASSRREGVEDCTVMGTKTRGAALVALAGLVAALAAGCSSGGSGGEDGTGMAGEGPTTTTTVELDDDLTLDQIQVIGTHNSFHEAPPAEELAQLAELDAEQAAERDYTHLPIAEQLEDQRIRQLELDVFADAEGGLYADPVFGEAADGMDEPGTKVLHEQDVDHHSVCPTLVGCLREVAEWSEANPDHVPILISIQLKDGPLIFDVPDQAVPEKWTAEALDGLDAEIASVFEPDQLITPEQVRGDHETLEAAVLDGAWPTLGESRGKVLFQMINGDPYRTTYQAGHEDLDGRLLFTNAEPGQPDAAIVSIDDPVADGARIAELVAAGYLVRTRADAPNVEARAGDSTRLEAALASGAQFVSTDYPGPDGAEPQWGTGYVAQLPGFLAARCNPVTAPAGCDDAAVEPLG